MKYKAVAFDVDGTLTASKSEITPALADSLGRLLREVPVAIMTGGTYRQVSTQVIHRTLINPYNLHIYPTSGGSHFYWSSDDGWRAAYDRSFTFEEFEVIRDQLDAALFESNVWTGEFIWGEQIERRGAQVTFSALGQDAPLEKKLAWDPKAEKRQRIVDILAPRLMTCEVRIGGTTSIDVTRKGVHKANAVYDFCDWHGIEPHEMLYVGDALFPGGNDEIVRQTGCNVHQVSGPEDTRVLIETLLITG